MFGGAEPQPHAEYVEEHFRAFRGGKEVSLCNPLAMSGKAPDIYALSHPERQLDAKGPRRGHTLKVFDGFASPR